MGRSTVYNRITSPELISKINSDNQNLCDDFLSYLSSIDRSPLTISKYKSDLQIFFVWNLQENKDKPFQDITKRELVRFQKKMIDDWKWGSARISRVKSAISSLSNYIENILDEEPEFKNYKSIIRKIESPVHNAVREKTVLEHDQVISMLDYLVKNGKYQQACIIACAAYSGCRKSEITRMRPEFFNDDHLVFGGAMYKTDAIKTKGRGSQGKLLNKYVLHDFKKYFDLWMKQRKELGIESEWLFVSKRDGQYQQMKIGSIDRLMQKLSVVFGLNVYTHAFRHFTTTEYGKANIPDDVIQAIMGWESADMVRIYKDIDADDQIGKYFDANGIKTDIKAGSLSDL